MSAPKPKLIYATDPQRWAATVEKTRELLITRARDGDPPIQYGELVRIVGQPPAFNNYRYVLAEVAQRERQARRPPVTALVVNNSNRKPGPALWRWLAELGYDTSDRARAWEQAKNDVYRYWKGR